MFRTTALLLVSKTIISTPSHTVCICLLVVSDAPSDGEPQWAEHTQKTQQKFTTLRIQRTWVIIAVTVRWSSCSSRFEPQRKKETRTHLSNISGSWFSEWWFTPEINLEQRRRRGLPGSNGTAEHWASDWHTSWVSSTDTPVGPGQLGVMCLTVKGHDFLNRTCWQKGTSRRDPPSKNYVTQVWRHTSLVSTV